MKDPERIFSEVFTAVLLWTVVTSGVFAGSELDDMTRRSDAVGTKDPPVDGVLPASVDFSLALDPESVVVA